MSEEIVSRIKELEEYVSDLRTIITAINTDIINGTLVPSNQQQTQIDHYASQGRKALEDINQLETILKNLNNE